MPIRPLVIALIITMSSPLWAQPVPPEILGDELTLDLLTPEDLEHLVDSLEPDTPQIGSPEASQDAASPEATLAPIAEADDGEPLTAVLIEEGVPAPDFAPAEAAPTRDSGSKPGVAGWFTGEMGIFLNLIISLAVALWALYLFLSHRNQSREEVLHAETNLKHAMEESHDAVDRRVAALDERVKRDIEEVDRRQSERREDAVDRLGRRIDDGDEDVRKRLDAAETRLIEQMDRDRETMRRELEGHRRQREDLRNQRRIDAVVETFEEETSLQRAAELAEEAVVDIARLIVAGVRDLRNDIECIHTVGRLVQRGGMGTVSHDLMRRILAVGMTRFFGAVECDPRVVTETPTLTLANVEETLARLEAERGRDPLDRFIPAAEIEDEQADKPDAAPGDSDESTADEPSKDETAADEPLA